MEESLLKITYWSVLDLMMAKSNFNGIEPSYAFLHVLTLRGYTKKIIAHFNSHT